MALIVGWSIDDARWVLGRDELTDFLPTVAVLGVVWGFISAKAGWSRWRAHFLGAVFAALIVPLFVGASLVTDHVSLHDWYFATAHATIQAYLDLAVRGRQLTLQYGHFMLILGLLCWATGQFAAYTAFGHKRPLNAVAILGIALLLNMSITVRDQLTYLVIFSLAALFFLIRMNALSERTSWIRRRIGDPSAVASLYLRGGVTFAALAVVGSLFLTASASSAPLANAFGGLDQNLIELGQQVQRYLPGGGPGTRITGVAFGTTALISGRWVTDNTPALQIKVPAGDTHVYYWKAVAFDQFDLNGWSLSNPASVDRSAGQPIFAALSDEGTATSPATRPVTFSVTPLAYKGSTVFSAGTAASVNKDTHLTELSDSQLFGTLDLSGGSTAYTVTAVVPETAADSPNGLTGNELRAATTDYPSEISQLYLPIPAGAVGPDMTALRATLDRLSPTDDPYDLAQTAVSYLRSSVFTYTTDVTNIDCGDRSVVECFAHFKQGYCQHYASTMVILMRMEGIPARLVEGFLPGKRDANGNETIRYSNSHAWVEVYFPNYGWVPFDPTGGGVAQLSSLPAGPDVPIPSVSPSAPGSPNLDEKGDPTPRNILLDTGSDAGGSGLGNQNGSLLIVALVLFIVVGAAAIIAYRRSRSGGRVQPDAVYGGVTSFASLLGFGPRPHETVFEYTGALGQAVPGVRPDLQVVANAKVEVAYGRHDIEPNRLKSLRNAQRRIRVRLLRLVFRRRGRR
jgi:transglutaminase-like putative cysteine protease